MKLRNILVAVLLVLLVLCGGLAWSLNHYLMPMFDDGEEVRLTFERGTSVIAIADTLESRGVVRSAKMFYYLLRFSELTDKVQSGTYTFTKGSGAARAVDRLFIPETIDQVLRVKEGRTVEQTAAIVAEQLGIDSTEFVRLATDSAFIATLGINTHGTNTLEGYLFPDTYRLPENSTAELVIRRMVSRFNDVMSSIDWDSTINAKYNIHQLITLAAIVEKEATRDDERGKIAGVFHNRLRKGWRLGADPTVRYIFRKFEGPLYVSELNNPSPYNTRLHVGLPPGPICSPGRKAIQASAKPDTTDAMFFVALWDGSGRHHFSKTNEEHDRMKFKVRSENQDRRNW